MDSEAFNRHPNRTKSRKRAQDYSNLTIPILPAELITEILSRLPVKSLLKFRCVSKSWLALISSPKFIKTHLSLSANKKEDTHHMLILDPGVDKWNFKECLLRSLYEDSVIEVFDLNYPFENSGSYISILGSCNGLIFVVHYSECSLLWNPTTKKYKTLPDFRPIYGNIYGFGYDELHDDYKVVDISCKYNNEGSGDMEVKIYSLKSDSWTSVDCCGGILNGSSSCRKMVLNGSSSCRKMVLNGSGLFANGKLHWETIVVGPNFSTARKGTNIISFDLANEKWEKMEQPSYGVGETDLCMGTFGSGLCVFSYYKGTHFSAWVMKEYGVKESWMKMFTIRYPNDRNLHLPPFFMPNKGEILGVFGSTFMIYNSKDDLLRYPDVINYDICHDRTIYIESLVCPFSTGGTENTTKGRLKKHKPKRSSNE